MRVRKSLVLVLLVLTAAAVAHHFGASEKAESKMQAWKIRGQLEEACSCNAACPCWFDSKPSKMNCGGGQILFIEKGTYGTVSLDGLAVGTMGQSPDGKGMMESFGNWNFNYFYIDSKGTPEQREALKAIATKIMGGASPNTEYRYVPITRIIEGKEHKISLGETGSFHGHLIEGGMGGAVTIKNPPGADPLHKEYQQGLTSAMTYNDAGQNWKFEGSNYMFGTFEVDSEMYEKHAAGLAQKMQKAKQEKK